MYGVVAVGYNRPASLKRLVDSIVAADYNSKCVDLIISIDKSDNQHMVTEVIQDTVWKNGSLKIVEHEERLGLRKHIIECGDLTKNYDVIIVLEDDLVVSPYFFNYILETVDKYEDDANIGGISLYKHQTHPGTYRPFIPVNNGYDVFMMQFAQSWGQCWTKRMWADFKAWYEINEDANLGRDNLLPNYIVGWNKQSWLKYFMRYLVESKKYFVYPYTSLSTNASDVGEHNISSNNDYQVDILLGPKEYTLPEFEDAVKYDVFFEREEMSDLIFNNLPGKKVLDLYGQRKEFNGADYLISTQSLPFKQVLSFQIKYRPHEQNCLLVEEGNDAFVYDLKTTDKKPAIKKTSQVRYDVRATLWTGLLKLGFREFLDAFIIKINSKRKRN